MTNESVKKKLLEASDLIEAALKELGVKNSAGDRKSEASVPKSLSDHILALRKEQFFAEPRTQKETYEKLRETYYCESKRVGVELIRLSRKKELRKASKLVENKKLLAYVW